MSPDPSVEDIEIRLLLEAIWEKYGYDLRGYAKSTIRRRVRAALARSRLHDLGQLQHRVLVDSDFFVSVLEDLTVRVSEMFRDPDFYKAFRARVVPVLRTYPLLRIWHGGCADGEEVYTSAILLSEEGLYERSQIYATDVSAHAIEQAKQGVYGAERLRAFAESYERSGGTSDFSKYYTKAYDRIAIRDSLRKNVLFFQHDLVSDHVFGEMHVIFCRNVLIYFGRELRERVLDKFAESLCHGGFLCLGSSERLPGGAHDGVFSNLVGGEQIYRREGRT